MFELEKKGYKKKQVEDFITNLNTSSTELVKGLRAEIETLKQENARLRSENLDFKSKEEQINKALISANEKAAEITKDSEEVFILETKKLQNLYEKYFDTMQHIKQKYGLYDDEELSAESFKHDIEGLLDRSISEDIKHETYVPHLREDRDDKYDKYYHKQLLSKLSDGLLSAKEQPQRRDEYFPKFEPKIDYAFLERVKNSQKDGVEQKASKIETTKEELNTVEHLNNATLPFDKPSQIKPILNMKKDKKGENSYTSLLEKYLNEDDNAEEFAGSAYAKKLLEKNKRANMFNIPDNYAGPNETGFDLREAVNPKESLEDIMSAFDFFEGNKNKK